MNETSRNTKQNKEKRPGDHRSVRKKGERKFTRCYMLIDPVHFCVADIGGQNDGLSKPQVLSGQKVMLDFHSSDKERAMIVVQHPPGQIQVNVYGEFTLADYKEFGVSGLIGGQ